MKTPNEKLTVPVDGYGVVLVSPEGCECCVSLTITKPVKLDDGSVEIVLDSETELRELRKALKRAAKLLREERA